MNTITKTTAIHYVSVIFHWLTTFRIRGVAEQNVRLSGIKILNKFKNGSGNKLMNQAVSYNHPVGLLDFF
jgi:hypothetical protein